MFIFIILDKLKWWIGIAGLFFLSSSAQIPFGYAQMRITSKIANKPKITIHRVIIIIIIIRHYLKALSAKLAQSRTKQLRNRKKYTELCAGSKLLYKNTSVKQINIVFNFIGGYHGELRKGLISIMNTDKGLCFLIERRQKWIICQNANIVKKFYEHV